MAYGDGILGTVRVLLGVGGNLRILGKGLNKHGHGIWNVIFIVRVSGGQSAFLFSFSRGK